MKRFIVNSATFLLFPLLFLCIAELVLPPTWFTFRSWEVVLAKSPLFIGPFYPNTTLEMEEVGGLAHHTESAVEKCVTWKTDRLGFRNDRYESFPDILIIGDSNIAGSSLSQNETLSSVLQKYTGLSVYNIAPADINSFVKLKNCGLMHQPQLVILSRIERRIPSMPAVNGNARFKYPEIRKSPAFSYVATAFDKVTRANSISFLRSRIRDSRGFGIQSQLDASFFFLEGKGAVVSTTDHPIRPLVTRIAGCSDYIKSLGSRFIFLPIPNKETILWDLCGLREQPDYVNLLNGELMKNEISTVDTIQVLNQLRANGLPPYPRDDSHWSKYTVDQVAKTIVNMVRIDRNGNLELK